MYLLLWQDGIKFMVEPCDRKTDYIVIITFDTFYMDLIGLSLFQFIELLRVAIRKLYYNLSEYR